LKIDWRYYPPDRNLPVLTDIYFKDRRMKLTAAVFALLAIALSASPVMASVADAAGTSAGVRHHRHHHHRRHHVADSVNDSDVAQDAAPV
jgi:hypothetical protein